MKTQDAQLSVNFRTVRFNVSMSCAVFGTYSYKKFFVVHLKFKSNWVSRVYLATLMTGEGKRKNKHPKSLRAKFKPLSSSCCENLPRP